MSKRVASSQLNKDAYERNRSSDSDSQEQLPDEDIIVLLLEYTSFNNLIFYLGGSNRY